MSDEPNSLGAPEALAEANQLLTDDHKSNLEKGEQIKFTLAKRKLDHDHEHRQQKGQRGALGWLFGGQDEKAGNVAGLMTLLCFGAIAVLLMYVLRTDKWENVDATTAVLGATLTACLGYLFGRK